MQHRRQVGKSGNGNGTTRAAAYITFGWQGNGNLRHSERTAADFQGFYPPKTRERRCAVPAYLCD